MADGRREALMAELQRREALQQELQRRQGSARPEFQPAEAPSFMSKIAPNLLASLANTGHEIMNMPYNMAKAGDQLAGGQQQQQPQPQAPGMGMPVPSSQQSLGRMMGITPEDIPHQQEYDFGKMLKLPNTMMDRIMQHSTDIPAFLATPEMEIPKVAGAVPVIGKGIDALSGMIGRGLPQVGTGAALSSDPIEGAKNMGIIQAVSEALPLPFKAIGKLADIVHPQGFANDLMKAIKGGYDKAMDTAESMYQPVLKKHGTKNIYEIKSPQKLLGEDGNVGSVKDALQLDNDVIKSVFPSKAKKAYYEFEKNPSLANAHTLQSTLGKESARLGSAMPDAFNNSIKDSLDFARDIVKKDINSFLTSTDSSAAKTWKDASDYFRDTVAPYRYGNIYNVASGQKDWLSPQQLHNSMREAIGKGLIPEGHALAKQANSLGNKINFGKLISGVANILEGEYALPGMMGAGAGLMFAPTTKAAKLIQNPLLTKMMKSLEEDFKKYKQPALGNIFKNLQGSDNGSQ